mmetsp:Transcript_133348/g.371753  ORF Transcript_133348/g.371753 Transcript_133348/m.371753 type:complete len:221 (+) Transcript_133348:196-858(+)
MPPARRRCASAPHTRHYGSEVLVCTGARFSPPLHGLRWQSISWIGQTKLPSCTALRAQRLHEAHCCTPHHALPLTSALLVDGAARVPVDPSEDGAWQTVAGAAALQLVAHEHELEAEPVPARAVLVVRPNLVATCSFVVLEQEGAPGLHESIRHRCALAELDAQDRQHCKPIAAKPRIRPIFLATQLALLAEGLRSRELFELVRVVTELQGLEGCLCVAE